MHAASPFPPWGVDNPIANTTTMVPLRENCIQHVLRVRCSLKNSTACEKYSGEGLSQARVGYNTITIAVRLL